MGPAAVHYSRGSSRALKIQNSTRYISIMSHPRVGRTHVLKASHSPHSFSDARYDTRAGHIPKELRALSQLERLWLLENQINGEECANATISTVGFQRYDGFSRRLVLPTRWRDSIFTLARLVLICQLIGPQFERVGGTQSTEIDTAHVLKPRETRSELSKV